jgi:transposase InsO family protein
MTQSMGAVGTSADNALGESFNARLKRVTLAGTPGFDGARACHLAVFRWVTRYNLRRPHFRLGNQISIDYEPKPSRLRHGWPPAQHEDPH